MVSTLAASWPSTMPTVTLVSRMVGKVHPSGRGRLMMTLERHEASVRPDGEAVRVITLET